jgi:hypothetical protein
MLRTDDILVVEFVARRKTSDSSAVREPQRVMQFSVRDEKTGTMMVIDDDWQNKSPLHEATCLDDGSIVVVSTAIKHEGDQQEHQGTARAITHGVALRMKVAGEPEQTKITKGYEVSKVWYAPEGNKVLLLGPDETHSSSRRY